MIPLNRRTASSLATLPELFSTLAELQPVCIHGNKSTNDNERNNVSANEDHSKVVIILLCLLIDYSQPYVCETLCPKSAIPIGLLRGILSPSLVAT